MELANAAARILPKDYDVLPNALEEYSRAARKHPGMTLECDGHTDATRLFALVEEIGEVAACLTYDNDAETGHGSDLESEVIQVIALALTLRDGGLLVRLDRDYSGIVVKISEDGEDRKSLSGLRDMREVLDKVRTAVESYQRPRRFWWAVVPADQYSFTKFL